MVDWIVVTGPESSGKTTLAQDLAQELEGLLVPEYSRIYLEQAGLRYGHDDLEFIAAGQRGLEHRALRSATRPIVSRALERPPPDEARVPYFTWYVKSAWPGRGMCDISL